MAKRKRLSARQQHPVKIQLETTVDEWSEDPPEWVTIPGGDIRAEFWGAKGGEKTEGMKTEVQITDHMRIRFFPGLSEKHRILRVRDGRAFNIRFINNVDFANRELILDLEAVK